MGWGYGVTPSGKEVGYSVEATCEHPECDKPIDRGLDYACGRMHGEDEVSCEGYFCHEHQVSTELADGETLSVCRPCFDTLLANGDLSDEETEAYAE